MSTETSSDGDSPERTEGAGWTNDHVRNGFDVDGAQSKLHPLGMDRRVRLAQAVYGGVGETGRALSVGDRSLYPVIRWIGALLGREGAAEQVIAEQEYVMDRMTEVTRTGVVSRRRLLGVGLFVGWWLLLVGGSTVVVVAVIAGVADVVSRYGGVSSGTVLGVAAGVLILVGLAGVVVILIHVYRDTQRQDPMG